MLVEGAGESGLGQGLAKAGLDGCHGFPTMPPRGLLVCCRTVLRGWPVQFYLGRRCEEQLNPESCFPKEKRKC